MTKSQQERLGVRLIASPAPADDNLAALHELLTFYGAILETTSERIRSGLDIRTTSRLKNTGTILEKLRRSGGATLKSMQDLAGMRIVGGPDRREQDETVSRVVELFQDEVREPKVIDRRADPVHGYSAVHVIVFPEGVPVEVQIRTTWQHEWAEVFEKLADAIGRGIRYGNEPNRESLPEFPDAPKDSPHHERLQAWKDAAELRVEADFQTRLAIVEWALAVAGLIDMGEQILLSDDNPVPASEVHRDVTKALESLRREIVEMGERHEHSSSPPSMLDS